MQNNILQCSFLQKFNIPDESIKKEMGIFQVAPETVRKRLEEFKHDPDTAPLLKISKVLKLLLYNNRIKTRLPILQECNLKCTNFQVLGKKIRLKNSVQLVLIEFHLKLRRLLILSEDHIILELI